MSILLDALKKSEEQRQLGKVPGIHSPVGSVPRAPASRRRWISWTSVAVFALIAAWIGWQQFRQSDPIAGAATETSVSDPLAQAIDEAPGGSTPVAPGTPVGALPTDTEDPRAAAIKSPAGSQQGESSRARVNKSFTAFEAARPPGPDQPVPEPSVQQARSRAPAQAAPGESAVPQKAEAGRAGTSQSPPPATEPISFWELPQGVRDTMPDLRITVLVYAERAEDRFLLMGGQRMKEQDQYQGGVVLDEIRRDGAVFLYRNYRFLVKG